LEGPRKEEIPDALRAKVKAASDGATGWLTVKNSRSVVFAEPKPNYYSIISSVALTNEMDIKNCSVVRKLAAGEVLIGEGEPEIDKDANIVRLKGKSAKDGKEGWITVTGNAGTVYARQVRNFMVLSSKRLCRSNSRLMQARLCECSKKAKLWRLLKVHGMRAWSQQ